MTRRLMKTNVMNIVISDDPITRSSSTRQLICFCIVVSRLGKAHLRATDHDTFSAGKFDEAELSQALLWLA